MPSNLEPFPDLYGGSKQGIEELIRERAYLLWLDECHRVGGPVHTNDWRHWFDAERELGVGAEVFPISGRSDEFGDAGAHGQVSLLVDHSGVSDALVPPTEGRPPVNIEPRNDGDRFRDDSAWSNAPPSDIAPELAETHIVPSLEELANPEYEGKVLALGAGGGGILAIADNPTALHTVVVERYGKDVEYSIVLGGR